MLDLALLYPRLNRKSGQKERAKRFALHGPRATQGELMKIVYVTSGLLLGCGLRAHLVERAVDEEQAYR